MCQVRALCSSHAVLSLSLSLPFFFLFLSPFGCHALCTATRLDTGSVIFLHATPQRDPHSSSTFIHFDGKLIDTFGPCYFVTLLLDRRIVRNEFWNLLGRARLLWYWFLRKFDYFGKNELIDLLFYKIFIRNTEEQEESETNKFSSKRNTDPF